MNLTRLNPGQKQAVLYTEGPLLILAGAGSGKTNTMTHRIAYLIKEKHVPATAILGLSFTRKAAEELKERVKKLTAQENGRSPLTRGLTVTTFHSLCVRILRKHCEVLGFPKEFTILDQNDQTDLVREILKSINVDDRKFDPAAILFEMSQAKNEFLSTEQAEVKFLGGGKNVGDYGIVTAQVYPKYLERLKLLHSMDFDDLLFHAVSLLEKHPEIRANLSRVFRYIMVDEYQDTNPAQFRLLKALTDQHTNLCVVGDDDQSIYAWRGAKAEFILQFSSFFPTAKTITLDQNYRSTKTILDAANVVIAKNPHRHPKSLWSDLGVGEPIHHVIVEEDRAEAEFVADEILKIAEPDKESRTAWKDFAILYRSNPQSRIFEEALRARKIPYKLVGALSYLDRKEIKDTLSYWKWIANSKDDSSLRRIINWPSRAIGKGALEAFSKDTLELHIPLIQSLEKIDTLYPRAATGVKSLLSIHRTLTQDLKNCEPSLIALSVWARKSFTLIGIKNALLEEYEDPAVAERKWENVDELANAIGMMKLDEAFVSGNPEYTAADLLSEFLSRLTLEASLEESDENQKKDDKNQKDQVTLLTFHGAKGLEFPVVFMVGLEEGLLPHRRTIEEAKDFSEERRLCYVGLTRAKKLLYLVRAKNRIRYGKPVPRLPSRFIEDIPKELQLMRNESYSPDPNSPNLKEEEKKHEEKVSNFLAQIRSQITGGKPPGQKPLAR